MVVQHNIPGMNTKRVYSKNSSKLAKSLEKLSSGYAINRAGDNAAGLAVSEKMRSQIVGIKQAVRNCSDGISLIQTFEGALNETVTIVKRMKSLAVQSANGTYENDVDRTAIEVEYRSLCDEVSQIADTDFNGIIMLNGREMADKFTFLTEHGIEWLTPSEIEFPEDSFVSTFRDVPGFPEIEMSIELLPEAKAKLTDDKELMLAFEKLNEASVRSFYNKGIPEFSLEGLAPEDMGKFSIETTGSSAIISTYTSKSGKVDIALVECTELPHYASTSAMGMWSLNQSVASGSYAQLSNKDPDGNAINTSYNLDEWTETYVNSSTASRDQRQKYLDWIRDTPTGNNAKAILIPDEEFDEDTNPLKFTWSVDGKEYENAVDENGKPTSKSGVTVPVYPAGYSNGPQLYFTNLKFNHDDEDMKSGAELHLTTYNRSGVASGSWDGRTATGGSATFRTNTKYLNIWLDHGSTTVTLTYDKDSNTWSDNFGGTGSWGDYGLTSKYYNYTQSQINSNPNYKRQEEQNLYHFYEDDGKLPDNFTLSIYVTCPSYRSYSSNGDVYRPNYSHNDKSHYWTNTNIVDFRMDEYDPANPAAGGVDYEVAEHGAVFTYDGRTQEDGTVGVWRDENGNAVNLAEKGVYLPTNPDSREILTLHDGMSITVNNPTMVGEDYIQADIRLFDKDRSVNAFRRIYDNITYADGLVLQTGARTKDSVDFTFSYSSSGIGDLIPDLNCTAKGLGIDRLTLQTQEEANFAVDRLDHALNKVSMIRSTFGAAQNRLEHKIDNLNNTIENFTLAESRIRDTDMAQEMMEFTKDQILSQASEAMLAQANSLPQQVMSIIGES